MYPRTEYEMTQEDYDAIIEACKPVACMMVGDYVPRSPQENANAAWSTLGGKMGFDGASVRPCAKGHRFFTAIPTEPESVRKEREEMEAKEIWQRKIQSLRIEIEEKQRELAHMEEAAQ